MVTKWSPTRFFRVVEVHPDAGFVLFLPAKCSARERTTGRRGERSTTKRKPFGRRRSSAAATDTERFFSANRKRRRSPGSFRSTPKKPAGHRTAGHGSGVNVDSSSKPTDTAEQDDISRRLSVRFLRRVVSGCPVSYVVRSGGFTGPGSNRFRSTMTTQPRSRAFSSASSNR